MQKTPLYDEHVKLQAKMVEFSGWMMPVEYQGLRVEHQQVRNEVGVFDVSHMGEILVQGEKALSTLQWLTTNDVSQLKPGQAQYTLLTNHEGGIVDDLIVYCLQENNRYLLCVNASNTAKDFAWMQENNQGADITDVSQQWGQLAIQGPKAEAVISQILTQTAGEAAAKSFAELPSFHFVEINWQGESCYVAKTGYTGEAGCEIFLPWEKTAEFWQQLLQLEQPVTPCGLGARDTLRLEMKYPLYGQELTDTTNPYAAGLGWVVKPKVKDFIGKEPILKAKEQGLPQKLVGFEMLENGIPRHGYVLENAEKQAVGEVTSGTMSPSTGNKIGVAYLAAELAAPGSEFFVKIRHRHLRAVVVETPFVKK